MRLNYSFTGLIIAFGLTGCAVNQVYVGEKVNYPEIAKALKTCNTLLRKPQPKKKPKEISGEPGGRDWTSVAIIHREQIALAGGVGVVASRQEAFAGIVIAIVGAAAQGAIKARQEIKAREEAFIHGCMRERGYSVLIIKGDDARTWRALKTDDEKTVFLRKTFSKWKEAEIAASRKAAAKGATNKN